MKFILSCIVVLFSLSISAQDFDPVNPDCDLLKQLIIEKINQKRERKKFKALVVSEPLQTTAEMYTKKFKETKFERNKENTTRINKKIKKICKLHGYKNAFVNYHIFSIKCLKNKGKNFYLDREDTEISTHLFEGDRPTKKERTEADFKQTPIKMYSYDELASIIVKQIITDEGTFKTLNNGYDKFGFSVSVEQRTLFRSKIPKIKAIIIVGGNRITW